MRLLLPFVLIIMLIGCTETTQIDQQDPEPTIFQIPQTHVKEDNPITIFKKNKNYGHYVILDSIIIEDDQNPLLKAVVSFYDSVADNSCNLAFIYGDATYRIGFATNEIDGEKTFEVDEKSQLTYVGDGAVTIAIRKIDTNELINYKITFSYDASTSTTNFKVEAEKQ